MLQFDEVKKMQDDGLSIEEFCEIIKKDLDILDNPKADKMIQIAFQKSGTLWILYQNSRDLVELIK